MRTKWAVPLFCLVAAAAYMVAFSIGGQPATGAAAGGVMLLFGVGVLAAGRSETVRGLRGDGRDERFAMLDLRATAITGVVLILVVITAFMVEIARGHSGAPFGWLGAIAGVTYVVSVVFLRLRG